MSFRILWTYLYRKSTRFWWVFCLFPVNFWDDFDQIKLNVLLWTNIFFECLRFLLSAVFLTYFHKLCLKCRNCKKRCTHNLKIKDANTYLRIIILFGQCHVNIPAYMHIVLCCCLFFRNRATNQLTQFSADLKCSALNTWEMSCTLIFFSFPKQCIRIISMRISLFYIL